MGITHPQSRCLIDEEKLEETWQKGKSLSKKLVEDICCSLRYCLSPAYHTSHTHQKRKKTKNKKIAPSFSTYAYIQIAKEQKTKCKSTKIEIETIKQIQVL
jgi:hypothetical protein